jgi:hypothetical protein
MASLSPRGRDLLSRRNVLRAAGAIVPLGLAAPHVFASSRPALSLDPVAARRSATLRSPCRSPWWTDHAGTCGSLGTPARSAPSACPSRRRKATSRSATSPWN